MIAARTARAARAVAGIERRVHPGRTRRRTARAADQDDRPRVSAVPDRAADFAEGGTLFRPAHARKKPTAPAQPLFVCALDDSPWTSEDEAVAHVLKNHFATFYQAERTRDRTAEGRLHVRRAMRLERRDSRPAELSRLPEPVAQAARGKIFADAVRRVQGARENREGRGRREEMDRGAELQDRIHLPQRAGAAQAARRSKKWKNISAPRTRIPSSSRSRRSPSPACRAAVCAAADCSGSSARNGSSRNFSRCRSRRS